MGTSHASGRSQLLASLAPGRPVSERAAAAFALGELEARAGDLGEALVRLDAARRLYAELGNPRRAAEACGRLGHALALRGDHERAASFLDAALGEAEAIGDRDLRARLDMLAADAAARAGAPERAREHWQRARAHIEMGQNGAALASIDAGLASLELGRGDLEGARQLAARAADEAVDELGAGRALAMQAEACGQSGDPAGAARLYREAACVLEDAGELRALAETCLACGLTLGAARAGDAASWLARAHNLFRAQGAERDVTRTREAFRRFGRRATDRLGAVAGAAVLADLSRARQALVAALGSGDPALAQTRAAELARAEEGLTAAFDALVAERQGLQTVLDLLRALELSSADVAGLPTAIARAAAQLTGAERAGVALRAEGGEMTLAGAIHLQDDDASWRAPVAQAASARGAAGFVGTGGLVVPLGRGDRLLGAVYCDKHITGSAFVARARELLVALAGQAAVILENARAAERLRLDARARAATLEAISDGVIAVDPGGAVLSWNGAAARLCGRPGAPPPPTLADWPELAAAAAAGGDVEAQPVTLPGGPCLCSLRTILRDDGQPVGRVAVLCELARAARLGQRVSTSPLATFAEILGETQVMRRCLKLAAAAAQSDSPVLLSGEVGTGKRLVAQAIHTASARAAGPFVVVECAILPRDTLEAELFGAPSRPGKVELAEGGSLLLVEVGELPPAAQARLALLLVERVPDVRVVATSSRELPSRFHRELRSRLRAVHIAVPPLRERGSDIPLLTERLLQRMGRRLGKAVANVSPEVQDALRAYSWPGNVRELEQVLEAEAQLAARELEILFELPAMILPGGAPMETVGRGARSILEAEHQLLVTALKQHRGNVPRVARSLGVSRGTVYNMMRKFRVDPSVYRVS